MLINWFTVFAQAVNFLILVRLLKRFLYKPILDAIDHRESGIADRLAEAEAKQAEARKEREDFQHKNEALDLERAALLRKAGDDAQAERQRLLDEARKDADALRAKRHDELQSEQKNLNHEIIRWTRKQVFDISRKSLKDLAGASLEDRMADVFVERIHALAGEAKEQLATAFEKSNHTVSVHSAFDLPPAKQIAIETAVKDSFAPEAHVQFETAPELVSGIELTTHGQKVAWSIADYLSTLEKSADELLHKDSSPEQIADTKLSPDPKPFPKPNGKPGSKAETKSLAQPVAAPPKVDR